MHYLIIISLDKYVIVVSSQFTHFDGVIFPSVAIDDDFPIYNNVNK